MKIQLDKKFRTKLKRKFEKYEFEVGILNDGAHYTALDKSRGLKSYAGGPARRQGRSSNLTISQVSRKMSQFLGFNYLSAPFKKKSSEIMRFANQFVKLCVGKSDIRRVNNLLQAVVRNPILRGDYGSNSKITAEIKGFNRFMIDTSQLFKSITAKARVRRV